MATRTSPIEIKFKYTTKKSQGEIWTLKNAYISKMHNDKWKLKIRLKYNNAELNVKERKNND